MLAEDQHDRSDQGKVQGDDPADSCCLAQVGRYRATVSATGVQANDIAWAEAHRLLFASISSQAAEHPNSIAVIDPDTAVVRSYLPTEPQPGALAVSGDGQFLYVGTLNSLQRFRLPSLALESTAVLPDAGRAPKSLAVRPGDASTVALDSGILMRDMAFWTHAGERASSTRWSEDGSVLYGFDSASTGMKAWRWFVPGSVSSLGSPFDHPYPINAGIYPWGITFNVGGGLLYAETGAVFDPASGGWPGTLPLGRLEGIGDPLSESFALASLSIEPQRRRAVAAVCLAKAVQADCGNSLVSFDLDTYLLVTAGEMPGVFGWAHRPERIGTQSYAMLQADRRVMIVSAPELSH